MGTCLRWNIFGSYCHPVMWLNAVCHWRGMACYRRKDVCVFFTFCFIRKIFFIKVEQQIMFVQLFYLKEKSPLVLH